MGKVEKGMDHGKWESWEAGPMGVGPDLDWASQPNMDHAG